MHGILTMTFYEFFWYYHISFMYLRIEIGTYQKGGIGIGSSV